MTLATRKRTRLVIAALALLLLAAAWQASAWWRAAQVNAQIASGEPVADSAGLPPELRFAQAAALARSGQDEAALNRYRALQSDPQLGAAARFNSANLLVRQAVKVQAGPQPGQAIALLELAKEYYRDVLRDDPGHWDARYNLERAQRLWPDPEETEPEGGEQARNRERAVTTMRGHAPGLP